MPDELTNWKFWLTVLITGLLCVVLSHPVFGQCVDGQCADGQCWIPGSQPIYSYPMPRPRVTPATSRPAQATDHPAVVRVAVEERDGISYGSGTLVDVNAKYGLVLTNWHVVREGCGKIEVRFPGGYTSLASVIKTDKDWDLAVLIIWKPPATIRPVVIARRRPVVGAILRVAGFGRGIFRCVAGRLIRFVGPGRGLPFDILEFGVASRDGDSGGPILNNQGELVGVLFGTDGNSSQGSHCERVHAFLADVSKRLAAEQPAAKPTEPAIVPVPAETITSVDQLSELRAEIAALRAEVTRLAAIQAKPGPVGPVGPPGSTAGPINYDILTAAVILRLPPITVQVKDKDGNFKKQTELPWGKTLQVTIPGQKHP